MPVKFWKVEEAVERRPANMFEPVKLLLLERRVDEAAVIVMFPVPSKDVPLMVRAFRRAVAVPALPDTEPVMVLATVREVVEAVMALNVVAKKLVVVALVVVALVVMISVRPFNVARLFRVVVPARAVSNLAWV